MKTLFEFRSKTFRCSITVQCTWVPEHSPCITGSVIRMCMQYRCSIGKINYNPNQIKLNHKRRISIRPQHSDTNNSYLRSIHDVAFLLYITYSRYISESDILHQVPVSAIRVSRYMVCMHAVMFWGDSLQ